MRGLCGVKRKLADDRDATSSTIYYSTRLVRSCTRCGGATIGVQRDGRFTGKVCIYIADNLCVGHTCHASSLTQHCESCGYRAHARKLFPR